MTTNEKVSIFWVWRDGFYLEKRAFTAEKFATTIEFTGKKLARLEVPFKILAW